MKKFCNKLVKQQWRVSVPNISFNKKMPNKNENRTSGSYDFEVAALEYEKTRQIGIALVLESESSDSGDYEDARGGSEKLSVANSSVYADVVDSPPKSPSASNGISGKLNCDVPKISFSFFEDENQEYQVVNSKPQQEDIKTKHISEVKITLSSPDGAKTSNMSKSETNLIETRLSPKNVTSILKKSGSDPNISHSQNDLEDEALYKVPKEVRKYRFSLSLDDLSVDDDEHISCSQIINENATENDCDKSDASLSMDYCKSRSKMPVRKRKMTLMNRPKSTAWLTFKTRLNSVVVEHASKQRVGAFSDKERPIINIEEVYKNSKDKCKKVLKTTGKIFHRTWKDHENVDSSNTCDSKTSGLTASDIVHKVNEDHQESNNVVVCSLNADCKKEDFNSTKGAFRRSKYLLECPNGFEDLRRYVKQGGDFCKELATILQERSEAELQYAKNLSKLSGKLIRACRENLGGLNDAWRSVAVELETRAEAHRILGNSLLEEAARPLRTLTESQQKSRKQAESVVDKATKGLSDWRVAEAKSKKHSHACARDNEKLQDAMLDVRLPKTSSLIQLAHMHNQKVLSEKENAKLEGKKRKAEDAVKKADIEYYTLCVRAERARLEWESAVLKGSNTFQTLEDERLNNLKSILCSYLHHNKDLGPRIIEATERLSGPVSHADPSKDLVTFISVRNTSQQVSEQLLPDFYCEHITLAMNRERRKQALVKLLHLVRQDIERENKSKSGLENLSKAIKETPSFGAEDSQQNVSEKLYHMKSMLTYLEASKYKVQSALAELDSRPKTGHPLGPHITVTRDKSGLQHSILKSWPMNNNKNPTFNKP